MDSLADRFGVAEKPESMTPLAVERIAVDLLLEAIFRRYGHDFRDYARATIDRRIQHFISSNGYRSVAELIPRVLEDAKFFSRLVNQFSIPVTEMFRDPEVFLAVREQVVPLLRTWPHFKVWHAGCATGEEVYSLAILLKEEALYQRSTIYATDFNEEALGRAREGIYPIDKLREATRNYQQAGGKSSLTDYFHVAYDAAAFNAGLRERLVFSSHNLATDNAFGEMHLIFCRNVLIYFNRELQNRVLELFTQCLVHGGFLCVGNKEDLQFTQVSGSYDLVDARARLYKKKCPA